jgi:hypothetical protein
MTQLLFDTPWWMPAMLAGLGIFLFWTGNRRQEAKVRLAGFGFLAAALLVMAVSYFVDTDLEKCTDQSKRLVNAVEQRDWPTMKTILAPQANLSVMGGPFLYDNRDRITEAAQRAVEQHGLKNVRVLSVTPEQTDTLITITMTLMSEQDVTPVINTVWQLEWQQTGPAWSLDRITCVKIGSLTGENAASQFPRTR